MLVELEECAFGYRGRPVVRTGELVLRAGRCVGIFGPNGSGKSTLVRGIAGLLPPLEGSVRRAADLRFGYLPQNRDLELHWPMSGLDAAQLAVSANGRFGFVGPSARARVRESMHTLGVAELARKPFARLSGGQQQRLLLAGALAAGPQVLLLDEPTDGLDVTSREILLGVLRDVSNRGVSVVLISHDVEDVIALCDDVAWLHRAGVAWLHRAGVAGENGASRVELLSRDQFAAAIAGSR